MILNIKIIENIKMFLNMNNNYKNVIYYLQIKLYLKNYMRNLKHNIFLDLMELLEYHFKHIRMYHILFGVQFLCYLFFL